MSDRLTDQCKTIDMLLLTPGDDAPSQFHGDFDALCNAFIGKVCPCLDHDPDYCDKIFKSASYDICAHDDQSTNQEFTLTLYWDNANEGRLNLVAMQLVEGREQIEKTEENMEIHGNVYIVKTASSRDGPYIMGVSEYDHEKVLKEIENTHSHTYKVEQVMTHEMVGDAVDVINKVLRSLPDMTIFANDEEVKQAVPITTDTKREAVSYFDIDPTISSWLETIVQQVVAEGKKDTSVIYCQSKSDTEVYWHIGKPSSHNCVALDFQKSERRCFSSKEECYDKIYAVAYGVTAAMFPESFKYTHCGNYSDLLKRIAYVMIPEAVAHWKANGGEGKVYHLVELEGRQITGEWYYEEEEGGKVKRETGGRSERLKSSAPYW